MDLKKILQGSPSISDADTSLEYAASECKRVIEHNDKEIKDLEQRIEHLKENRDRAHGVLKKLGK